MMPFDGENLSFFERGILQNLKTFFQEGCSRTNKRAYQSFEKSANKSIKFLDQKNLLQHYFFQILSKYLLRRKLIIEPKTHEIFSRINRFIRMPRTSKLLQNLSQQTFPTFC